MNLQIRTLQRIIPYLPLIFLIIALLEPSSISAVGQVVEVIVEDPHLQPTYTTCPESYWYPIDTNRGHTAYLTLNAYNPANSTNHADWRPVIPQSGYYRIEAYIPAHNTITWCTGQGRIINHDTTDAHYTIHHTSGITPRILSQYPLSNQWLNLGEYYFTAGNSGYVTLIDLNGETEFSTTVSFSAMRFTFTRSARPNVYIPLLHRTDPSGQPPPDTGVIQAQGFDACHLPEISEMQTWWNKSPYQFYALYMGGVSLYGECDVADSAWVSAVHQQGWSFVPTWVGPQAPCSTWLHKMSSDPATAYQEGRQEAQAASTIAASMGLTNYGLGGTVIYYDMEYFGGASNECRQTVKSFMNGWVERLHELGNIAGGYGSRNSYILDWATLAHVPDQIWVASWYTTIYDPEASVYGISWLNGLWTNNQRIRQYTGGHNETWGGTKFNIDSDVADGMVALPPSKPLSNPVIPKTISIKDVGWLSAEQGWLITGNHLYWTDDQGKNWQDISPDSVQVAHFLPLGEAWAFSTQLKEHATLYHTDNWGGAWEAMDLPLPANGTWKPLQLQFTSPEEGWLVLQRETSQAFNSAILMKTSNGGRTWQKYELPSAAPVNFTSSIDGWMIDRSGALYFQTVDGGATWHTTSPESHPKSLSALPENTTQFEWHNTGFGWALTSTGSCTGEKSSPDFTCQLENDLQQSLDGGKTWIVVPLPSPDQE